ncbi:nitroreductase family protein, partial [Candidatus Geothermarchaeota archaeon]
MNVLDAIRGRRSIRRYFGRDIPHEALIKVLDAARWAPSAKNSQPWEFIVIKDNEIKKKISELAPFGSFIKKAPVAIAVVTDPSLSPNFHQVDGACAVQNLMLAAHSLGLGTCWIGPA